MGEHGTLMFPAEAESLVSEMYDLKYISSPRYYQGTVTLFVTVYPRRLEKVICDILTVFQDRGIPFVLNSPHGTMLWMYEDWPEPTVRYNPKILCSYDVSHKPSEAPAVPFYVFFQEHKNEILYRIEKIKTLLNLAGW